MTIILDTKNFLHCPQNLAQPVQSTTKVTAVAAGAGGMTQSSTVEIVYIRSVGTEHIFGVGDAIIFGIGDVRRLQYSRQLELGNVSVLTNIRYKCVRYSRYPLYTCPL